VLKHRNPTPTPNGVECLRIVAQASVLGVIQPRRRRIQSPIQLEHLRQNANIGKHRDLPYYNSVLEDCHSRKNGILTSFHMFLRANFLKFRMGIAHLTKFMTDLSG